MTAIYLFAKGCQNNTLKTRRTLHARRMVMVSTRVNGLVYLYPANLNWCRLAGKKVP
jgi:hypothetical protein